VRERERTSDETEARVEGVCVDDERERRDGAGRQRAKMECERMLDERSSEGRQREHRRVA
jgi:hypothetical protein